MKHILSEIKNYHETKKEHEKCSNQKGKTGENIVFDMLENTLPSKEYTILDCSKKGHSCDILIKRIKYPDIRVECKNYSSNVKTLEIVKFERDLEENNDSGIFISLSSGICGKKN